MAFKPDKTKVTAAKNLYSKGGTGQSQEGILGAITGVGGAIASTITTGDPISGFVAGKKVGDSIEGLSTAKDAGEATDDIVDLATSAKSLSGMGGEDAAASAKGLGEDAAAMAAADELPPGADHSGRLKEIASQRAKLAERKEAAQYKHELGRLDFERKYREPKDAQGRDVRRY